MANARCTYGNVDYYTCSAAEVVCLIRVGSTHWGDEVPGRKDANRIVPACPASIGKSLWPAGLAVQDLTVRSPPTTHQHASFVSTKLAVVQGLPSSLLHSPTVCVHQIIITECFSESCLAALASSRIQAESAHTCGFYGN